MKLSKTTQKELAALVASVEETKTAYEDGIKTFNDALAAAREPLEGKKSDYEGALTALRERLESERDDFQSEFDDRSETWQEGERGSAARDWIDSMTSLFESLDAPELDIPADIDDPEFPDTDEVANLPEQPE